MYFSCPSADVQIGHDATTGNDVPECTASAGSWVAEPQPFLLTPVGTDYLGPVLTAGLLMLAVAWVARVIADYLESHF